MGKARPEVEHYYGRRRGRRLRSGQRRLMADLLPRLAVSVPDSGLLNPETLFGSQINEIWLEIGFGSGEHLAWQAEQNPQVGFIGAEPYLDGVARLLTRVVDLGLENVRIVADDIRPVLRALAQGSIARLFILFPDPWHKTRHHRRRIVQPKTLDLFAHLLSEGAEIRFATDDSSYLRWVLRLVLEHPKFTWNARRPVDWSERLPDWPVTRYEAKAKALGRAVTYLRLCRIGHR